MSDQDFRKNIRAVLTVSAFALLTGPALAASLVALNQSDVKALDANQDGYIDMKEAEAMPQLKALMKTADKDRDGRLSEAEFLAMAKGEEPRS